MSRKATVQDVYDDLHAHMKVDEERMATLATKKDIEEVVQAFKDFTELVQTIKKSSKWTYRTLIVVASISVAIVSIGGGFKMLHIWWLSFTSIR